MPTPGIDANIVVGDGVVVVDSCVDCGGGGCSGKAIAVDDELFRVAQEGVRSPSPVLVVVIVLEESLKLELVSLLAM